MPHELPDNLSSWPHDPHELLGVPLRASPKDIRRAYTQLIRKYKPEQSPDQFQRIRDAYETALRHAEMFGAYYARESPPEEESEELPAPRPESSSPQTSDLSSSAPLPSWQRTIGLDEELAQLWERACSGEESAVYARLKELRERHLGNIQVLLRLYWLLALTPDLEQGRSPCDWLVEVLTTTGLTGPLRELYRREIVEEPSEALSSRFEKLLEAPATPERIAEIVELRWQAAGKVQVPMVWLVIEGDLAKLGDMLISKSEETWFRLLLAASEQLAGCLDDDAGSLLTKLNTEIHRLEHLHFRMDHAMDRHEMVLEASRQWRKLRREHMPQHQLGMVFLELMPLSLCRPFEEVRPLLLRFLDQLVSDPEMALTWLDKVGERAPVLLGQLGVLLTQYEQTLPWPLPQADSTDILKELTQELMVGLQDLTYEQFRRKLLQFCLREAVRPEQVAENTHLEGHVREDRSLRHVCLASLLFWA